MSRHPGAARVAISSAGLALAAAVAVASGGAAFAAVQAQERYSVWDGVYSEEQADRGKVEYEYNCGTCHIHDLTGDSIKDVPALAGDDFLGQWGGKTVAELLDYMVTNMPADSRGSLPKGTYADITSYVLKVNNFPAGKDVLGSDPARLAKTVIERQKK